MESNVGTWEVGSRSHRHIKLTSTYGTILTEHVLNAGRKTSKRQENPHITRQERKKKKAKGIGMGPAALGGSRDGGMVPGRSLSGRETSGEKRALRRSDPARRTAVGCLGRA